MSDQEQEALALAAAALADVDRGAEQAVLARMRARTASVDAAQPILDQMRVRADARWRRADAKTKRLMDWIGEVCFPDGEWNNERVIVFTEYRATLNYLDEILTAPHPDRPSMTGRVEVFHGSLDSDERERIIREFNYNPHKTRVRVLLATDAASEGIDLHRGVSPARSYGGAVQPEPDGAAQRPDRPVRPEVRHGRHIPLRVSCRRQRRLLGL